MKILVMLLSGIGDVLQATPMLRLLRKKFPRAEITGLAQYGTAAEILKNNADLDEVIHFHFMGEGHFRSLKFVMEMRKRSFDACIMAYPANRWQYNLISFLIGARLRVGSLYDIKRLSSLSFLQSKRIPLHFQRHTIDENVKLLEALGAREESYDKSLYFPLKKKNRDFAKRFFKRQNVHGRVIGIHPGSSELSGMINKRWAKERFVELCDKLAANRKATMLVFGGRNEELLKRYIFDKAQTKPVLVPEMGLLDIGAIIEQCELFICNDTALMHVAGAVGTKTLVIEGPTNPYKTMPLVKGSRFIAVDLDCRPCYQIGETLRCKYRNGRYDCLNMINVDKVYKEALRMLR